MRKQTIWRLWRSKRASVLAEVPVKDAEGLIVVFSSYEKARLWTHKGCRETMYFPVGIKQQELRLSKRHILDPGEPAAGWFVTFDQR